MLSFLCFQFAIITKFDHIVDSTKDELHRADNWNAEKEASNATYWNWNDQSRINKQIKLIIDANWLTDAIHECFHNVSYKTLLR